MELDRVLPGDWHSLFKDIIGTPADERKQQKTRNFSNFDSFFAGARLKTLTKQILASLKVSETCQLGQFISVFNSKYEKVKIPLF